MGGFERPGGDEKEEGQDEVIPKSVDNNVESTNVNSINIISDTPKLSHLT